MLLPVELVEPSWSHARRQRSDARQLMLRTVLEEIHGSRISQVAECVRNDPIFRFAQYRAWVQVECVV